MAYRILVDENVDPGTDELLREDGHEAAHVTEVLSAGTTNPAIADHAREHDYTLLTNDADFLRKERRQRLTVLYVPDNAMRAHEIAALVGALAEYVPDADDLPAVTLLTDDLTA